MGGGWVGVGERLEAGAHSEGQMDELLDESPAKAKLKAFADYLVERDI